MTRFLICGEQTHALNKQRCHRNRQKQFKILWNQMVLNKSWLYCKMWNVTGHKIDSVQTCLELLALNGLVFFCRFSSTKEYISLAAFYTELFWHISFFKTAADHISTFSNYSDRFTSFFHIQEAGRLGFRTFSWQGTVTDDSTTLLLMVKDACLAGLAANNDWPRMVRVSTWAGLFLGTYHQRRNRSWRKEETRWANNGLAGKKNRKNFIASCCC